MPLQHMFTTMHAVMEQGSMIAAFPPIVITGGRLSKKFKTYKVAQLIESDVPINAQGVPQQFNPGLIPAMIKMLEEEADTLLGITQLGIGQDLKQGTTATAAALLGQSQRMSQSGYMSRYAEATEPLLAYLHELGKAHYETIEHVYAAPLGRDFLESLDQYVAWKLTAKAADENPQVQLQQSVTVLSMAEKPNSGLDYGKVEKAVLNMFRVPFDVESLMKKQGTPVTSPDANLAQEPAPLGIEDLLSHNGLPGVQGVLDGHAAGRA